MVVLVDHENTSEEAVEWDHSFLAVETAVEESC